MLHCRQTRGVLYFELMLKEGHGLKRRRHHFAFTLIEVLVVVVIIGILAALFTPLAGKLIEQSRTAKSTANLRQLGVAWHAFAAERDGRLASVAWRNSSANGDNPGLREYLDLPSSLSGQNWQRATVFTCPVLQSKPATATTEAFFRTYSVNERACDFHAPAPAVPSGLEKRRLSAIKRPSQFAVAMSGSIAPGNPVSELYAVSCSNRQGKEQLVQMPHGSPASPQANVLFADGHVALTDSTIVRDTSATSVFWRDASN